MVGVSQCVYRYFVFLSGIFLFTCNAAQYKELFEQKRILITGGTGFIGRALIEGILPYDPAEIVVFSRDEVKHYKLLEQFKDSRIRSQLGDVRDYSAIYNATKGMDIVIHAAALKRIDMIESHVYESVYTNVIGSLHVVRACRENNIPKALLVSTDKACLPINAYGGCKFVAEKLFTNNGQDNGTIFSVVRYGNVLQSTGSVIPFFCEKIKNKEAVPLTDEAMTRFFISKEQAVELIFKALLYGTGRQVFVPMLPAFKIMDLIEVLQEKLGNKTNIVVVGLRPGEKIHEAMINSTEIPRARKFKDMFIIESSLYNDNLLDSMVDNEQTGLTSDYTSEGSVLQQNDLKALLEKYNIIL
jgi:FlaA1/EpsC-like NDP-sugar epimerase